MNATFVNLDLDIRTTKGRKGTLLTSLVYRREDGGWLRAPRGSTTDGISVPRIFWALIPSTGAGWFSGVLHDAAYHRQLEIHRNYGISEVWLPFHPTRKQADQLMRESLQSQGIGWFKRNVIYYALRLFGGKAFRKNQKT